MNTYFNVDKLLGLTTNSLYKTIADMLDKGPVVFVTSKTPFNAVEAAEYLNVRVNYFNDKLAPLIPKAITGERWSQHRWYWQDLKAYHDKRAKERAQALDEMCQLEQEMGLYDY